MNKYLICNEGCDDTTYTEIELNDEELKTLIKIAKENNKTGGGCKPIIHVYKDYKKNYKKDEGYFIIKSNFNYETFKYEWEAKDLVGSE